MRGKYYEFGLLEKGMSRALSQYVFLLFLLLLALLFSGCLTFRQTLTFNQDSSCVATFEYSLPEEYVGLWQNAEQFLETKRELPTGNFFDEKAVRKFFADNGLELRQYRQYIENKIRHVEIIVLARDGAKALNSGVFGDFRLVKDALGDSLFSGSLAPFPGDLSAGELARLQKMAEGLSFQFRLKVPTAFISSNGTMIDYRQTEWNYSWPQKDANQSIFAPERQALEASW